MMLVVERLLAGAMVVPFALGLTSADAERRDVVLEFADPQIVESSGLVASGGLFVTVNDSGDEGRTFVVDRDGETVGGASWGEATDVEAVAPWGRDRVLVGDIGDNRRNRDSVRLLRLPLEREQREVAPEVFEVTYPGGPVDAEALLVHPVTQQVLVASKELLGGTLYAAPRELSTSQPNRLRPLGPVLGFVTDGAFFPDGRHLVLRDYGRAVFYAYPSLEPVATVDLPRQEQGEGIAVDARGTVYVSSEGQRSEVLRIDLPGALRDVVTPPPPSPTPTPSASTTREPAPATQGREGRELPEEASDERPFWPWFLTGWLGLGVLVVLLYALRRR
ncbi:esterase-like activity of phytase family protein [Nocardioides sp. cx-169]|uniref:esterase-like activity of phytase family protein n=1 Tax=Nocardioides sp. cx-169 TaxID=2899080 RepID=UPI001E648875|nr:esterase-like activity of phytase family protein [Nocardioides sp. cx-169]MCD4533595.1 esterase-like activity of phytase family protein [Nocardioides sp. cx-169]